MNVHGIVNRYVSAINPNQKFTIRYGNGWTNNPDGGRVPIYVISDVWGQFQPLQYTDITQMDALNVQGLRQKIWINGVIEGLVRATNHDGDLIRDPKWRVWKVAMVAELWGTWTSALVTLQNVKYQPGTWWGAGEETTQFLPGSNP